MAKKNSISKEIKAKTKKVFSNDKIKHQNKLIKTLENQKESLKENIIESITNCNTIFNESMNDFAIGKLPFENLKELYLTQKDTYKSVTDKMNQHTLERKRILKIAEKLETVDYKIQEAEIDLAIAKIQALMDSIK